MISWGSLIAEGTSQTNPIRIYWWLIVFPGAVLVSTLLALNSSTTDDAACGEHVSS